MQTRIKYLLVVSVSLTLVMVMVGLSFSPKPETPTYHGDIASSTMLEVQWPFTNDNMSRIAFPRLLESKNARVSTPLTIYNDLNIDLGDYMARMSFYNTTLPTSIWIWEVDGTGVGIMRVIGPVHSSTSPSMTYTLVEFSRLTMMQMTLTLPDGLVVQFSQTFGETIPAHGYAIEILRNWGL